MDPEDSSTRIMEVLSAAKELARAYRELTGKPLGITGEVAEYEAAKLLGLRLMEARTAAYDAERLCDRHTYQIKGRCLVDNRNPGQRLGKIDTSKRFDAVLLVELDKNFNAMRIFEADRSCVVAALETPGSKARNERGQLSISKFRSIGWQVWPAPTGQK